MRISLTAPDARFYTRPTTRRARSRHHPKEPPMPLDRRLGTALLVIASLVVFASRASGDTTKGLLDCQRALDKQGAKLVKARTKYLGRCVAELLACQVAFEVDGTPP